MERETPYTLDQQRVADWILARSHNQLGAGEDPIGFLLASYEQIHAELTLAQSLVKLCEKFVRDQHINCEETVYQSDRVIENAYEFIHHVCDIVGYHE
jgi:GTP-dependent phosphoenolpyruvate carboxykinase